VTTEDLFDSEHVVLLGIKKDVVICHILALVYDTDQLGN
jgi:hypothetical protein